MLLSLALIIIIGFMFSEIAKLLKLPRIIGMMAAGILLGPYVLDWLDTELISISPDLRRIALIVILLRAGLSIDFDEIKRIGKPAIKLAFLPAVFEVAAVVALAPLLLDISYLQAAILGSILAAVSPAIVVPKMLRMMREKHGTKKDIPQTLLAGASADDVFVIVLFSAFTNAATNPSTGLITLALVPVTIVVGVAGGYGLGGLLHLFFKHFTMRDTKKLLILFGVSLLLLAAEEWLREIFPFSGLLVIFVLGVTLLTKNARLAERLVERYEKIWIFAELLLFVLVGAAVHLEGALDIFWRAALLVILVLFARSAGTYVSTSKSGFFRRERLFMVIAYLPKATVQASLAGLPLAMGIPNGETILAVAVISIIITSPIGAYLTDATKNSLVPRNIEG